MELAGGGCLQFIVMFFTALFMGIGVAGGDLSAPPDDVALVEVIFVAGGATSDVGTLQQAAEVVTQRLTALSLEPISVSVTPDLSIAVTFPALASPTVDEVIAILTANGSLELVDFTGLEAAQLTDQPITTVLYPHVAPGALLNPLTNQPFEGLLSGEDVLTAQALVSSFDPNLWMVSVTFTPEAGERLAAFTREHVGEPLGIVVDGIVVWAPVIQTEIGSEVEIQGNFSQLEAQRLAVSLGGGALPIKLVVASIGLPE
jgi:preprotein translocase subunit SecD